MISPLLAALALVLVALPLGAAEAPFITVASTTSTEQSGLFDYLLPIVTRQTGIAIHVVAQGTGQALATARHGDADVVFVHDKPAELEFLAAGFGVERRDVMYNDFVLVGPSSDPAAIAGLADIVAAFRRIAATKAAFASRGDDSGTDKAERRFWREAGIDAAAASGSWYRETGSGMGATLNTAAAMGAYTLSDRGTWLNFRNRGDLRILVAGDKRLFNQYGVMLVNPQRYPGVKENLARIFIDWLTSAAGQAAIAGYRIDGEQLFFPNYRGSSS